MPADTPAQEAPMTDPIKLAREALRNLIARYDEVVTTPDCSCGQDDHDVQVARTALAALDAIQQPAPVPADAELDALQERLVNPRQWSLKGDARRAADALSALRTRLAEVEGALECFVEFDTLPVAAKRPDAFDRMVRQPIMAAHRKLKEGK